MIFINVLVGVARPHYNYNVDDLYQASCAHEQCKWAQSIGVATTGNKQMLFVMPMDHAKQFVAHSSQSFADYD